MDNGQQMSQQEAMKQVQENQKKQEYLKIFKNKRNYRYQKTNAKRMHGTFSKRKM
jgi:hypothetical protein